MIVSAATIPNFDGDRSKKIVGGLTRLYADLQHAPPPGFLQGWLLREDRGDALFLAMWASRSDLDAFMSGDRGLKLAQGFGQLLGDKSNFKDYFVTWQTDTFEAPRRACGCGAGNGKDRS